MHAVTQPDECATIKTRGWRERLFRITCSQTLATCALAFSLPVSAVVYRVSEHLIYSTMHIFYCIVSYAYSHTLHTCKRHTLSLAPPPFPPSPTCASAVHCIARDTTVRGSGRICVCVFFFVCIAIRCHGILEWLPGEKGGGGVLVVCSVGLDLEICVGTAKYGRPAQVVRS